MVWCGSAIPAVMTQPTLLHCHKGGVWGGGGGACGGNWTPGVREEGRGGQGGAYSPDYDALVESVAQLNFIAGEGVARVERTADGARLRVRAPTFIFTFFYFMLFIICKLVIYLFDLCCLLFAHLFVVSSSPFLNYLHTCDTGPVAKEGKMYPRWSELHGNP